MTSDQALAEIRGRPALDAEPVQSLPTSETALADIRSPRHSYMEQTPRRNWGDAFSKRWDRYIEGFNFETPWMTEEQKERAASGRWHPLSWGIRSMSGFANALFTGDIVDAAGTYIASKRVQRGTATPKDYDFLVGQLTKLNAPSTIGYKAWDIVLDIPPFVVEFLAGTKAVSAGGRAIAAPIGRLALKKPIKTGARRFISNAMRRNLLYRGAPETLAAGIRAGGAKYVGRKAGELAIRSAVRAPLMPRVFLRSALERITPGYQLTENEEGQLGFLLMDPGEKLLPALAKAYGESAIEGFSEETGAFFGAFMKAIPEDMLKPVLKRGMAASLLARYRKLHGTLGMDKFAARARSLGWNGMIGEMLEERVGDIMRFGTGLQPDLFPSKDQLIAEAIAFAIPGVTAAAVNYATGGVLFTQAEENMLKATKLMRDTRVIHPDKFGPFVDDMTSTLDELAEEDPAWYDKYQWARKLFRRQDVAPQPRRGSMEDFLNRYLLGGLVQAYRKGKTRGDSPEALREMTEAYLRRGPFRVAESQEDYDRLRELDRQGRLKLQMFPGGLYSGGRARKPGEAEARFTLPADIARSDAAVAELVRKYNLALVYDLGRDQAPYGTELPDDAEWLFPDPKRDQEYVEQIAGIFGDTIEEAKQRLEVMRELRRRGFAQVVMFPGDVEGTQEDFRRKGYGIVPEDEREIRTEKGRGKIYRRRLMSTNTPGRIAYTFESRVSDMVHEIIEHDAKHDWHGQQEPQEDNAVARRLLSTIRGLVKERMEAKETPAREKKALRAAEAQGDLEYLVNLYVTGLMGFDVGGLRQEGFSLVYGLLPAEVVRDLREYAAAFTEAGTLEKLAARPIPGRQEPGPGQRTIREAMEKRTGASRARQAASQALQAGQPIERLAELLQGDLRASETRQAVLAELDRLEAEGITFSLVQVTELRRGDRTVKIVRPVAKPPERGKNLVRIPLTPEIEAEIARNKAELARFKKVLKRTPEQEEIARKDLEAARQAVGRIVNDLTFRITPEEQAEAERAWNAMVNRYRERLTDLEATRAALGELERSPDPQAKATITAWHKEAARRLVLFSEVQALAERYRQITEGQWRYEPRRNLTPSTAGPLGRPGGIEARTPEGGAIPAMEQEKGYDLEMAAIRRDRSKKGLPPTGELKLPAGTLMEGWDDADLYASVAPRWLLYAPRALSMWADEHDDHTPQEIAEQAQADLALMLTERTSRAVSREAREKYNAKLRRAFAVPDVETVAEVPIEPPSLSIMMEDLDVAERIAHASLRRYAAQEKLAPTGGYVTMPRDRSRARQRLLGDRASAAVPGGRQMAVEEVEAAEAGEFTEEEARLREAAEEEEGAGGEREARRHRTLEDLSARWQQAGMGPWVVAPRRISQMEAFDPSRPLEDQGITLYPGGNATVVDVVRDVVKKTRAKGRGIKEGDKIGSVVKWGAEKSRGEEFQDAQKAASHRSQYQHVMMALLHGLWNEDWDIQAVIGVVDLGPGSAEQRLGNPIQRLAVTAHTGALPDRPVSVREEEGQPVQIDDDLVRAVLEESFAEINFIRRRNEPAVLTEEQAERASKAEFARRPMDYDSPRMREIAKRYGVKSEREYYNLLERISSDLAKGEPQTDVSREALAASVLLIPAHRLMDRGSGATYERKMAATVRAHLLRNRGKNVLVVGLDNVVEKDGRVVDTALAPWRTKLEAVLREALTYDPGARHSAVKEKAFKQPIVLKSLQDLDSAYQDPAMDFNERWDTELTPRRETPEERAAAFRAETEAMPGTAAGSADPTFSLLEQDQELVGDSMRAAQDLVRRLEERKQVLPMPDSFVSDDGEQYAKQADGAWTVTPMADGFGAIDSPQTVTEATVLKAWKDVGKADLTFEEVAEIVEEWKQANNIVYDPQEAYDRNEGFFHDIGAFNPTVQALWSHIGRALLEQSKALRRGDVKYWKNTENQVVVSSYTAAPVESGQWIVTRGFDENALPTDIVARFDSEEKARAYVAEHGDGFDMGFQEERITRPGSGPRVVMRPSWADIVWAATHDVYSGTAKIEAVYVLPEWSDLVEGNYGFQEWGGDERAFVARVIPVISRSDVDNLLTAPYAAGKVSWEDMGHRYEIEVVENPYRLNDFSIRYSIDGKDHWTNFADAREKQRLANMLDLDYTTRTEYTADDVPVSRQEYRQAYESTRREQMAASQRAIFQPKAPHARNVSQLANSVAAAIEGRQPNHYNELGIRQRIGNFYLDDGKGDSSFEAVKAALIAAKWPEPLAHSIARNNERWKKAFIRVHGSLDPVAPYEQREIKRASGVRETFSLARLDEVAEISGWLLTAGDEGLFQYYRNIVRDMRAEQDMTTAEMNKLRRELKLLEVQVLARRGLPSDHRERAVKALSAAAAMLEDSDDVVSKVSFAGMEDGRPVYDIERESATAIAKEWDPYAERHGLPPVSQLVARMGPLWEKARQRMNRYTADLSEEEWLRYLDNYILHRYRNRTMSPEEFEAAKMRLKEQTGRAERRRLPTYMDAARVGLEPITMDVSRLYEMWMSDVANAARTRLFMNIAPLILDQDGKPAVIPVQNRETPQGKYTAITPATWRGIARRLYDWTGVAPEPGANPRDEVARMVDMLENGEIENRGPLTAEYDLVPTPSMSMDRFLVRKGVPRNIMASLLNERYDNKTNLWHRIGEAATEFNMWSKTMMLAFSGFHPFSLAESAIAAMGLTKGLVRDVLKGDFVPSEMLGKEIKVPRTWRTLQEINRRMKDDPSFLGPWIRQGSMVLHSNPDVPQHKVDQAFMAGIEKLRRDPQGKPFVDMIGAGLDTVFRIKRAWDYVLWNEVQPTLKLYTMEQVRNEYMEWAAANNVQVDDASLREDIAQYVNDAFGGQEWQNYVWATPKARQWLHWALFSPDWTISAANVSGVTRLPGVRAMHRHRLSAVGRDQIMRRYWPAMTAIVLYGLPHALQYAVYMAYGDDDEGDVPFPHMNEWGKQTHVDLTPILRKLPGYKGGETGRRRAYIRWGKQAYEVFQGWLRNPADTALRKTSSVVRTAMEQTTGMTTSGWELPFRGQGLAGWISAEGSVGKGRAAYIAEKFLPISILPVLRGELSSFIAPMSRGASLGRVTVNMHKILEGYANPEVWNKVAGNAGMEENLADLMAGQFHAAERNGVDGEEAFKRALSRVKGQWYREFFLALNHEQPRRLERAAHAVIRLGVAEETFTKAMERRFALNKIELADDMRQRMRVAFERAAAKYDRENLIDEEERHVVRETVE